MFVPERAVVLVGSPRTGSTTLARALDGTGVLGHPHEWFWRMVEGRHAEEMGLPAPTDESYGPYLEAALRHGTTPNGVFGSKLFFEHAKDLVRRTGLLPEFAGLEPIDRLWEPFGPQVARIHLQRDVLRAALSVWRAEVSGVWGLTAGEPAPPPPERLDRWRVTVLHAEGHAAEDTWARLLTDAMVVTYDDVVADLAGTVQRIAERVGVVVPPDRLPTEPAFVRQADDASDRFLGEWWAWSGGCDRCAAP